MENLLSVIENLPNVAVLIYQEKIVFANKCAIEKLEYTFEELKDKSIEDFVPEPFKNVVLDAKNRRVNGEIFEESYFDFPIITKNRLILRCAIFASTIEYKGKSSGLIIALDITEKIILERTIKLVGKVHELASDIKEENRFIQEICKSFAESLEINFSFVAKYEEDKFDFFSHCGIDSLSHEKVLEILNKPDILKKLKLDEIISGKLELEELKSFCVIPIIIEKKLKYAFIIFSSYLNFMDNLNLDLLQKLKATIVANIENIEKENNLLILYKALEISPDWVLITDKKGKIVYANKTVEKLSKYSQEELIGKRPSIFRSGYYDEEFYNKMWKLLQEGNSFSFIVVNKDKEGRLFKLDQTIIPVKTGNEITHFVSVGKDLSIEEKLEVEILTLKYKDVVTGLFNRHGFIIEMQNMINNFKYGEKGILVIIDIYNFSYINNLYTEKVGDEILKEVANFLISINKDSIIGRIGGDEFAIFKKIEHKNIIEYVHSLLEIFKISKFSSYELVLGFNIGASIYPDDTKDLNQLINNATTSLTIAKSKGENKYEFFNKEIATLIKKKKEEKDLIINALENDWFEVFLQPYFVTKNLKLAGFEALLRIKHPTNGILTPYHFIETLEESEFLFDVEKLLIRIVGETLLRWKSTYLNIKPISINLTARSFRNEEIIQYLIKWLKKIKASLLNIELTERLFIDNLDYALNVIKELKKFGVHISLDDFGTGYSSLSYLTEMPVDIIKIDITFIRKIFEDEKTRAIVEVIVSLAKKLGFKTIAEGVESEAQLNFLKDIECDFVQGFLFAKPCPIKEAENYFNL